MTKIKLNQLNAHLIEKEYAFICCASFEKRSISVAQEIKSMNFVKVFIFANHDSHESIITNAHSIHQLFNGRAEIIKTSQRKPLETSDEMLKVIKALIDNNCQFLLLDITTFTHETLLIFLRLLNLHGKYFKKITCVYTGASEYSVGDNIDKKWLSKGCRDVRSVIGYPGRLVPGKPITLYLLVGFEYERAIKTIFEVDPEYLFLGKGMQNQLTNKEHKGPMDLFHKIVRDMVSSRGKTKHFEFSCSDPHVTEKIITDLCEKTNNYNNIIVPLNTKLSTVGVALAAFKNETLQVCYAEPEHYNFQGYSKPDKYVRLYDISWST
jgi:hypothetical protein